MKKKPGTYEKESIYILEELDQEPKQIFAVHVSDVMMAACGGREWGVRNEGENESELFMIWTSLIE